MNRTIPLSYAPERNLMVGDPPLIHPTAVIDPRAELADDVRVGPYAVIEEHVRIGPGCIIGPHAHILGHTVLGSHNQIGTGAVIGDRPQHLMYRDEPTRLEIGSGNVFREHVTIHRGSTATGVTIIGDNNYFMVHSHAAHDVRIGNHCMFANGAMIAGHCVIEDRVLISGCAGIHQFCRVGRLALLSGLTACTMDLPPFVIMTKRNQVSGINIIGMRRAGIPSQQISVARKVFAILYRSGLTIYHALKRIDSEFGDNAIAREMTDFIRASKRGICGGHHYDRGETEAA